MLVAGLLWAIAANGPFASAKPRAPLGKDPGGLAVALVGSGVDYTRADVAARLARDGEGEPIGWDAVARDPRPFGPDGDLVAKFDSRIRVVPVAVDGARPDSFAEAVTFLGRTPARIAVVAASGVTGASWRTLREAAGSNRSLLLLIAADGSIPDEVRRQETAITVAAWPAGSAPPATTVGEVLMAPGSALREMPGGGDAGPRTAAEAAIALANLLICEPGILQQARSPQDARSRILARARKVAGITAPVVETCPTSGR